MFCQSLRLICSIALLFFILASHANANQALANAAEEGNLLVLNSLLEQGIEVDSRLVDGTTALHWAVNVDQFETANALIEAGANPQIEDRYGITAIYLAALNGNLDILTLLLDSGANPNTVAPTGETTLMTAARTGLVESLSLLIERGADINIRDPHYQQNVLMMAVRENHALAVAFLINNGADINAQTRSEQIPELVPPCKGTGCGSEGVGINRGGLPDRGRRAEAKGGMTSLIYAARDGHVEIAQLLIEAGADLEQANASGISALLMSLLNDRLGVADILLDQGANPNVADMWGRSPLFAAVEYRNLNMNNRAEDDPQHNGVDRAPYLTLIEKLISHGANLDVRTRDVAPIRKWLHSLNDVSWVDFTGQTPFIRASFSGDVEVMQLLLGHGADPHITTFEGTTALMAAAGVNWTVAQTYTESPQRLIEAINLNLNLGADVNATNSMGLTALLGAANRGSNDIINILVTNGARLDIVDAQGRSPKRWAEGVFLAAVGAEIKPSTIALLEALTLAASDEYQEEAQ